MGKQKSYKGDLDVLVTYYNCITGYSPGVADKLLLRKYAESWEGIFEFQTIAECFLEEYRISNKKLKDIPLELFEEKLWRDALNYLSG